MLKAIMATVTRDVQVDDALPLTLKDGDRVRIGEGSGEREGYVWADDGGLCAGWVPQSVLHLHGHAGVATTDYCSAELAASRGDSVRVMWKGQGFAACWCENRDGERGWIPSDALEIAPNQGVER